MTLHHSSFQSIPNGNVIAIMKVLNKRQDERKKLQGILQDLKIKEKTSTNAHNKSLYILKLLNSANRGKDQLQLARAELKEIHTIATRTNLKLCISLIYSR